MAQIVGNLLNNACKFTERGGRIWLTVDREEQSGADRAEGASDRFAPQVAIHVRDGNLQEDAMSDLTDLIRGTLDLLTMRTIALEPRLSAGVDLVLERR